jgi:cobalamin biosynthesis protein CbiD
VLFEPALQDYEPKTKISLANHQLAEGYTIGVAAAAMVVATTQRLQRQQQ